MVSTGRLTLYVPALVDKFRVRCLEHGYDPPPYPCRRSRCAFLLWNQESSRSVDVWEVKLERIEDEDLDSEYDNTGDQRGEEGVYGLCVGIVDLFASIGAS